MRRAETAPKPYGISGAKKLQIGHAGREHLGTLPAAPHFVYPATKFTPAGLTEFRTRVWYLGTGRYGVLNLVYPNTVYPDTKISTKFSTRRWVD